MASKNGDQVLVAGEEVTNSNSSEAKQFMKMSEVDGRNATGRERDCGQLESNEKYLISLFVRAKQVKNTVRFHLKTTRMTVFKTE